MLDNKLIESALWLTWTPVEEVEWITGIHWIKQEAIFWFSIAKFCYYLLSTSFIGKYTEDKDMNWAECSQLFWNAIYEYQAWLEEPLTLLLKKI